MVVIPIVMIRVPMTLVAHDGRLTLHGGWSRHRCGTFDDLVKFAPVQPDAATLGAIVNFDALPFGHDKVGFRPCWAFHIVR
jgi:hypothetical protein